MKILITGAAGFLGLHLAQYYVAHVGRGGDLTLIDIAPFTVKEYPQGSRLVSADIRDSQKMSDLLDGVDFVIHAAAALPLWRDSEIYDINVGGTATLLAAAYKRQVKRFVYISSTAVYGVPKKHPVLETDPLVGVGPYGNSKIQAEKLCRQYRKKNMIVTVIRPKTFVGTYRLGVFEILFDWIKDGKKIPVIGSGKNRYQLLDVDDLVEVLYRCLLLKDERTVNDTFNVGAKEFGTVATDLQALFKAALSRSAILPIPAAAIKPVLFIFEKLKLSPLYRWVYDTADKDSFVSIYKIMKAVHWRPRFSNAAALIKAYRWYEKHYDEIKSHSAGVTHTVGWKQGVLGLFKKFL
ncbi:NAD(P)-dependent oxidoreductase [Candidatus Roizmanbacteria bacterium]|nr:NAD(P)-dependent oxidoreductase [Candidatus Roizmanbacteria bacterium]